MVPVARPTGTAPRKTKPEPAGRSAPLPGSLFSPGRSGRRRTPSRCGIVAPVRAPYTNVSIVTNVRCPTMDAAGRLSPDVLLEPYVGSNPRARAAPDRGVTWGGSPGFSDRHVERVAKSIRRFYAPGGNSISILICDGVSFPTEKPMDAIFLLVGLVFFALSIACVRRVFPGGR